jgi:hypothetical protein
MGKFVKKDRFNESINFEMTDSMNRNIDSVIIINNGLSTFFFTFQHIFFCKYVTGK